MKLVRNPLAFVETPELGMGFQFARQFNPDDVEAANDESSFAIVVHGLVAVEKHELYSMYYKDRLQDLFRKIDRIISLGSFSPFYFPEWSAEQFPFLDGIKTSTFSGRK